MVIPPTVIKEPEHHLGNFVTAPQNLEQLKFQQQSAAALGKSMNLAIQSAQPISSMQRGIVTDSEYTIPVIEQVKYRGVNGLAPTPSQRQESQRPAQQQVKRRQSYDWEF